MTKRFALLAPWISLLAILIVSWWLRTEIITAQPFDYDEGHWLMFGALVNAGHPAYENTFVGIPPLALLMIRWGLAWFGPTLSGRYPMMALSLIGVASLFWLLRPNRSGLAAVLGAIFLSFNSLYFRDSATIMAEVPAVALALLALALARQYHHSRRLEWLALSGMVFALSLAVKVFVIFLPALVAFLMLGAEYPVSLRAWRRLVIAGLIWAGGGLVVVLLFGLTYDVSAMIEQVFRFRLELRQVWQPRTPLSENITSVARMWLQFGPLLIGAILGGLVTWRQKKWQDLLLWGGWLLLSTLVLVWHIPLRERYAVMLAPGLAALSGICVAEGLTWLRTRLPAEGAARPVMALGLVGIIGWAMGGPVQAAILSPPADTFPDLNLPAVRYAWQYSLPTDCLITDDQRFAFAADRLVPPALSETSWARIITGWLTADEVAAEAQREDCPLVIYVHNRFQQQLPALQARLRSLYALELAFSSDVIIYTGGRSLSKKPALPLEVTFGQVIRLEGIDVWPSFPWRAGDEVWLAGYWTALAVPGQAYKITVQLHNQEGEVVAGADHFPFPVPEDKVEVTPHMEPQAFPAGAISRYPGQGMWPTYAWPTGQTVREVTRLVLPSDLRPGRYKLYVGLYDPETLVPLDQLALLAEFDLE